MRTVSVWLCSFKVPMLCTVPHTTLNKLGKVKLVRHEVHSSLHSKHSGTTKPVLARARGCKA
eukprot:463837-Pelagomonas_calceolata.AAC.2